jgi:hypothetical protein
MVPDTAKPRKKPEKSKSSKDKTVRSVKRKSTKKAKTGGKIPGPKGVPGLAAGATAQRRHMIAERAYFRARERDFCSSPWQVQEDWLAAEVEVDALLAASTEKRR